MLIHIADILGSLPIEKAPVALNNGGPVTNINSVILPPHADDAKAFSSVAARADLLGHTFQRHGNIFLIGRWGHTREFGSLAEAAQWLDQIGGKS